MVEIDQDHSILIIHIKHIVILASDIDYVRICIVLLKDALEISNYKSPITETYNH